MAEEKKEGKEEKEPSAVKADKEKTAAAPVAPAPAGGTTPEVKKEGKKKKIRKMSLEEVEKALAHSRTKMGGEAAVYVRHLLDRKKELGGMAASPGPES